MANDLRLQVVLDAINRATGPLRQINRSCEETASGLRTARERLRELNTQQRDIDGWRQQNNQARQTSQALDAARARVRQMGREMASTTAPTRQMNEAFQTAARAANELKRKHGQQQQALQGLRQRLNDAGIDTRQLNQHSARLRADLVRTNQTIREQENRLRQLATAQRNAAQAQARLSRTQARASAMAVTGTAGVATGAGIAATGVSLVAPQLAAQEQGAVIAAQNGESSERSGQYTEMMRGIRSDGVSTDIQEISSALGAARSTLGSLGNTSDQVLESTARKALDLSRTMGIDVAEAIQMVGILMQNGLAKDSDEALDLVTAGLQKIPSQMRGEIPEILQEYSTFFRGMGYSGSEAMSLLVEMSKQGKFALDKTGDSLKEFSILGSNMSKSSQEAYSAIGLNAEQMSSAVAKGGSDARDALLKTAKALLQIEDPAELANAAISLFGTPVEELSIDQIPAFLKRLAEGTESLGDFSGAADAMGKTLRNNLAGDLDKLTGAWSTLLGSLMDGQDGALRDVTQSITGLLHSVRAWIDANPELAANLIKGAAAIAVLIAVMGALTIALASVLGPFALVRYGLTMFNLSGTGAVPILGRLAALLKGTLLGAIRLVGIALWALATNPVALAIAALVVVLGGAAYLIYRHWDTLKGWFAALWSQLGSLFNGGIGALVAVLAGFNPLEMLQQAFAGVLSYLGLDLPTRFGELGGMLVSGLIGGLTAGLGQIKEAISSLGDSTIGWFKEKLGIHSPSRVFAELGGFTTEGLALGLNTGAKAPLDAMSSLGERLTQAGALDLKSGPAISMDDRPPIGAGQATSYDSHDTIHINIHPAPGMDPQAIARAVGAELERRDREKSARQRSQLSDPE